MPEQPLPRQLSDPLRALPVRGRRLVGDSLGRGQGDTVRRGVPALGNAASGEGSHRGLELRNIAPTSLQTGLPATDSVSAKSSRSASNCAKRIHEQQPELHIGM